FVRHAVHDQCGYGMEGVKPAARLIDPLGDEICREGVAKAILVLEGVVALREGHRSRVEPDVDKIRNTPHGPTVGRRPRQLTDEWPEQVADLAFLGELAATSLAELRSRAYHRDIIRSLLVGLPDG